jgi:hypothetical protein
MLAAGYLDTWTRRNTEPGDGPTCCQIEDLTNPSRSTPSGSTSCS